MRSTIHSPKPKTRTSMLGPTAVSASSQAAARSPCSTPLRHTAVKPFA